MDRVRLVADRREVVSEVAVGVLEIAGSGAGALDWSMDRWCPPAAPDGCSRSARGRHPTQVAIPVDDLAGAPGLRAVHSKASDDAGEPLTISW